MREGNKDRKRERERERKEMMSLSVHALSPTNLHQNGQFIPIQSHTISHKNVSYKYNPKVKSQ